MASESNVVAVYRNHVDAQAAIEALEKSDFCMTKVSVVGKDDHTEERASRRLLHDGSAHEVLGKDELRNYDCV
jgi:hypothetical protein